MSHFSAICSHYNESSVFDDSDVLEEDNLLSDKELVYEVLAGSVESYAVLVDRWQRAAIAEALRTVRDGHIAEDIAQEAFVAAYEKLGSLHDPKMFGSWLLTATQIVVLMILLISNSGMFCLMCLRNLMRQR